MKQQNVLLIAVGGIGFRHFQALLNCQSDFTLYVVDVSAEALAKAEAYAAAQTHNRRIHYAAFLDALDAALHFRLAIIATSSLPRKEVFKALISRHAVDEVIFEKVLFPRLDDYDEVTALLKAQQTNAYVNCSRRTMDFYQSLREELRFSRCIRAAVTGSNWGLACNSIHMVDLIDFLASSGARDVSCDGSRLEDKLYESKRPGYTEFYGLLVGRIDSRVTYSIECCHGETPMVIELLTETHRYQIEESAGRMTVQSLDGFAPLLERHFRLPYTSQLTDKIVDRILSGQPSGLAGYAESYRLHIPLLQEFLKKQNQILGEERELCPIT